MNHTLTKIVSAPLLIALFVMGVWVSFDALEQVGGGESIEAFAGTCLSSSVAVYGYDWTAACGDDQACITATLDALMGSCSIEAGTYTDPLTSTDVCPNIADNQATVPVGKQIVNGQCVDIPPAPSCPLIAKPSASFYPLPTGTEDITIDITNLAASAGIANEIGYYFADANHFPISGAIVWANVKTTPVNTFKRITIAHPPANAKYVGFFSIPTDNKAHFGADGQAVTWHMVGTQTGPIAPWVIAGYETDGRIVYSDSSGVVHVNRIYEKDVPSIPGNSNWEDALSSDNDFNDLNFQINIYFCTTPPPTDVCPNIAGNQASIPDGYQKVNGQCLQDACPNLSGFQNYIPAGKQLVNGQCVDIPVDVCPNIAGNQATVPAGKELVNGQCVDIPPAPSCPLAAKPASSFYTLPAGAQNLTIDITKVATSAGWQNEIGYYFADASHNPISGGIIWANVNTTANGAHKSITIATPPANAKYLGFFSIPRTGGIGGFGTDGQAVTFHFAPIVGGISGWVIVGYETDGRIVYSDATRQINNRVYEKDTPSVAGNSNWEDFGSSDGDFDDLSFNISLYFCTAPPPTDFCPNIAGNQASVPQGYQLVNGQCTLIPVDVCPNIAGTQTTVPAGKQIVNGQCVDIPPVNGCIEVFKETFNPEGQLITKVAQFTFKLDGIKTAYNNSTGYAKFSNVTPGTHTVTEIIPAGWTQLFVTPTGGQIVVPSGPTCVSVNFKNKQVISPTDLCPNIAGVQTTIPAGKQLVDGQCVDIPPEPITIKATKIVCEDESDLPNWGGAGPNGGPYIHDATAIDFVADHPGCHLEPNWKFEWATGNTPNPGDEDEAGGSSWHELALMPDGTAKVIIESFTGDQIWVREQFKNGYIPFTGVGGSNVSAEMYCHTDVYNYDNYDNIADPEEGETYYCVAFNAPVPPHYGPYCGDGVVNQSWEQCDGGSQCTAQCQPKNQCVDIVAARVNVTDVKNATTKPGNMTSDLFVGGSASANKIPENVWFALSYNGTDFTDPAIQGYEDVPGLAVERVSGSLRLRMHGSYATSTGEANTGSYNEHIEGFIQFFQADLASQVSDTGQNKADNPTNGVKQLVASEDEIWTSGGKSYFWLSVTVADDGFSTTYDADSSCPVADEPICTLVAEPDSFPSSENGHKTTVTWTTTNATSFVIDHGLGTSTPVAGGSRTFDFETSLTLTGTATGPGGTATCEAPITVEPPQNPVPACTLSASATSIAPGESITLSWTSENVSSGSANGNVGALSPVSLGSMDGVYPSDDITYTATFTGPHGNATCSVFVDVRTGGGGCSGNSCPGGLNSPTVTLLKAPGEQPLAAFVYLSQIPYTGFEAGPMLTLVFWFAVALFALVAAYFIVGQGGLRYFFTYASDLGTTRVSDSEPKQDDMYGIAYPSLDPAERSGTQYGDKYGQGVSMSSYAAPLPAVSVMPMPAAMPVVPAPVAEAGIPPLTSVIESRAHAAGVLISPEAVTKAVRLSPDRAEALARFGDILNRAIQTIPRDDGWVMLTSERFDTLSSAIAEKGNGTRVASVTSAASPVAPVASAAPAHPMTADDAAASEFVNAVLSGNRNAAFGIVRALEKDQISPIALIAGTAVEFDRRYRANPSDERLHRLVEIFAHAVDGSYPNPFTGVKLALAQAFEV